MCAAIPHALVLLHALVDLLPYPKGPKGMWYEIHTGSVDCVDEVAKGTSETPTMSHAAHGNPTVDLDDTGIDDHLFQGIGAMEEEAPDRKVRVKVRCPLSYGRYVYLIRLLIVDYPYRSAYDISSDPIAAYVDQSKGGRTS